MVAAVEIETMARETRLENVSGEIGERSNGCEFALSLFTAPSLESIGTPPHLSLCADETSEIINTEG